MNKFSTIKEIFAIFIHKRKFHMFPIIILLIALIGVTAPLIGQKSESHVTENMDIMKIPPLSESEFNELLKKMVNRS